MRKSIYKNCRDLKLLSEGTRILLKIFTKDEMLILLSRVKHFDHLDWYVRNKIKAPLREARHKKLYNTNEQYRQGVDQGHAEMRERMIELVNEGKVVGLLDAKYLGYDIEDEMIQRGISIPNQDLLDIKFYRSMLATSILDKAIKELLKIFIEETVVRYLELLRDMANEEYLRTFHIMTSTRRFYNKSEDMQEFTVIIPSQKYEDLDQLFDDIGTTLSDAIEIFLDRAILVCGFPFSERVKPKNSAILAKGTQELLKFLTKKDMLILIACVKRMDNPVNYVKYRIEKNAEHQKRYDSDECYRQGIDQAHAEMHRRVMELIHEGKLMGLLDAKYYGFDNIEEEMKQQGLSIPEQDLLNAKFYRSRLEESIIDKGIKELSLIFTQDEMIKYFEELKVNGDCALDPGKEEPEDYQPSEPIKFDVDVYEAACEEEDDEDEDDSEVITLWLPGKKLYMLEKIFDVEEAVKKFLDAAWEVKGFPFD